MTQSIIKAVEKGKWKPLSTNPSMADSIFVANVWAIIAKGWSSRGGDPAKEGQNIAFPESCYGIDKVPHAWLFPRGEYNLM